VHRILLYLLLLLLLLLWLALNILIKADSALNKFLVVTDVG